jgi:hypothetical protein
MDELIKRFEIIRLASLLGDQDTILIQCTYLLEISQDPHMRNIVSLLEARQYRQAAFEMTKYLDVFQKSFLDPKIESLNQQQDSSKIERALREAPSTKPPLENHKNNNIVEEEDKEVLKKLIKMEEEDTTINLNDMKKLIDEEEKSRVREYESIPEFPADEILEEFKQKLDEAKESRLEVEYQNFQKELEEEKKEEITLPLSEPESMKQKSLEEDEEILNSSIKIEEDTQTSTETKEKVIYQPLSYIDQKFNNMIYQYPPIEDDGTLPDIVKEMKDRLSIREYTEEDIEEFLDYYFKFKEEGKLEEAAKVLLLAASTESKYAKFLLARELFKGEVLKQNLAESFNMINSLADQNYAEAICDLGQFYEHGIAITKDKDMAKLLYKEAADLGLERAKKHYERLENSSKGVIGILNKLKSAKKVIKKND